MGGSSQNNLESGEVSVWEADEYAEHLGDIWDAEICQLHRAQDVTRSRYVADDSALLYEETMGMDSYQKGSLIGDHFVIVIPGDLFRAGLWQGMHCPEGALPYVWNGTSLDLFFSAGTTALAAVIPKVEFQARFEALSGQNFTKFFDPKGQFLRVGPDQCEALTRRWRSLLFPDGGIDQSGSLADLLTDSIVSTCLSRANPVVTSERAARRTFAKAMGLTGNGGSKLSPANLALELGVSARTLYDAFRVCARTSPSVFLKRLRLQRVRKRLMQKGPSETTVTSEALAEGFTEFGRFSGEYRQLFGELPSATLRQGRLRRGIVVLGLPPKRKREPVSD